MLPIDINNIKVILTLRNSVVNPIGTYIIFTYLFFSQCQIKINLPFPKRIFLIYQTSPSFCLMLH